ncbi:MAG: exodeoxyribonuclease VII large subunit [Bdellovibrionaceae bacterium]|nr:exodeoxyribonuclease VII large subunit [Pseudobdellovibrionaceae bacterium]
MANDINIPLSSQSNLMQAQQSETTVLTVEQLNLRIKQLLEGQMVSIWLRGEISNFKAHTSGHFYFSLKDAKSQISAVMFRGFNSKIKFKVHDGLEVLIKGRISVFEPRGSYQILCEHMEPVGAGALQKAFEELKTKLKSEGLFESSKKRAIPSHPNKIVVISSPTGAAIQDFIQIVTRRAPFLDVTLIPTLVQGDGAPEKIMEALQMAWKLPNVDIIVLARGGGSIEDLWAFNDERLVRMIAQSPIPTISAVGHEIDFTISDFVADLRAPTPSAAAELVAKSSKELHQRLVHLSHNLNNSFNRKIKDLTSRLENLRLRLVDPQKNLQDLSLRNDELLNRLQVATDTLFLKHKHKLEVLTEKMPHPQVKMDLARREVNHKTKDLHTAIKKALESARHKLESRMAVLDSISPLKVLDRGYSIVTQGENVIRSADDVDINQELGIKFCKGAVKIKISELKKEG